jgi:hypothetical protein
VAYLVGEDHEERDGVPLEADHGVGDRPSQRDGYVPDTGYAHET